MAYVKETLCAGSQCVKFSTELAVRVISSLQIYRLIIRYADVIGLNKRLVVRQEEIMLGRELSVVIQKILLG